jgi:hypothetical protein
MNLYSTALINNFAVGEQRERRIYVGNLPPMITTEAIKQFCKSYVFVNLPLYLSVTVCVSLSMKLILR